MKSYIYWLATLILYFILLVWVIIFKMELSLDHIAYVRRANFQPFNYAGTIPPMAVLLEIISNVLIFIPFGFLLKKSFPRLGFLGSVFICFMLSSGFEVVQYKLAVGRFDVTDIITNTSGGMIGIVGFYVLWMYGQRKKG